MEHGRGYDGTPTTTWPLHCSSGGVAGAASHLQRHQQALHRTSGGVAAAASQLRWPRRPLHSSSPCSDAVLAVAPGTASQRSPAAPRAPMQCSLSLQVLHLSARRRLDAAFGAAVGRSCSLAITDQAAQNTLYLSE
ncbi:hypothetical protein VPH35_139698 [Triticum aestivum]